MAILRMKINLSLNNNRLKVSIYLRAPKDPLNSLITLYFSVLKLPRVVLRGNVRERLAIVSKPGGPVLLGLSDNMEMCGSYCKTDQKCSLF